MYWACEKLKNQATSQTFPPPFSNVYYRNTFISWDILKEGIENWAIKDHFQFIVLKKDESRADYRCRHRTTSNCSWRVFASKNRKDEIEAKKINREYTCAGANITQREISNTQSWLRRVVPQHLFVTKATNPKEIVDCIRIHFNTKVNYKSARITKPTLMKYRKEYQCEQFKKIPAYIALLHSQNDHLYTDLQTVTSSNSQQAFQYLFICPHQSQQSFTQMRKLMAVDGTFLKAWFVQTLLLAVGIDGNGKNLLLAWAVIESENKSLWKWFLTCLWKAIPDYSGMDLISDHNKGLLAAD